MSTKSNRKRSKKGVLPSHIRARHSQRTKALLRLGFKNYGGYLASAHWYKTRALYRASDLPQACICGAEDGLQLHHMTYDRIGEEELTDLVPLCPNCHAMIHTLDRRGDMGLELKGLVDHVRAAGYAVLERQRVHGATADVLEAHLEGRVQVPLRSRIDDLIFTAELEDVDVSRELALLDATLARIHDKLIAARTTEAGHSLAA
jgi:5-methylcytosine-specific restriction endonuclease McrA